MNGRASARRFDDRAGETLLFVGLTAVLLGYLTVWLPGPAAGLRLIGVEIGEWIKFLGVGQERNWFYLPPIALGLILALLSIGHRGARAWGLRALAVVVSLLSFPAVAAILGEPRSEWLARLAGVGLVALVAVAAGLLPAGPTPRWAWIAASIVAAAAALLPTWQYLAVLPVVEGILRESVGIGPGVWLNLLGGALVAVLCAMQAMSRPSGAS
jgi:hypothetical protein